MARTREGTDAGITCLAASSADTVGVRGGALVAMAISSGVTSAPDSISHSRRIRCAAGPGVALPSSSRSRLVSWAAVLARIVATPSSRLSSSVRAAVVIVVSDLIRARSSRTSRAMTWNFVRLAGPTLPSIDFASTSRTRRARIGMIGAGSSPERCRWFW